MSDETAEFSREQISELEAEFLEGYKEYEAEVRRSIEISSGFYEKLSALDAGSIAIAVSVGMAIAANPTFRSFAPFSIVHWLIATIILLWTSLITSVLHNFLSLRVARLDAAYSEIQYIRNLMKKGLKMVRDRLSASETAQLDQLSALAHEKPILSQQKFVRNRQLALSWAPGSATSRSSRS